MYLRQAFHQRAEVQGPAPRGNLLLRFPPVRQQANAIARIKRHLRQRERRIHRVIELAGAFHSRPQEPSRIQDQPNHLAPLDLINFAHQAAAPRRSRPTDVPPGIARAIIAQTLEVSPLAPLLLQPFFQLDLAGAHQIDGLTPRFFEIRIDTDDLREIGLRPALRNSKYTLILYERGRGARRPVPPGKWRSVPRRFLE